VVKDEIAIAHEILLPLRTFDGLKKGFVVLARSFARPVALERLLLVRGSRVSLLAALPVLLSPVTAVA